MTSNPVHELLSVIENKAPITQYNGSKNFISLVIPVFNEEKVLPFLFDHIDSFITQLDYTIEVILVDDGSSDATRTLIHQKAAENSLYRAISLSRNFGHQIAITAGMKEAKGEGIVIMDADLQDPPEVIHNMLEKWQQGYDVIYAQRVEREGENSFKRWAAHIFYRSLQKIANINIPLDTGDFRLVDRKALDVFLSMQEHHRFVRGMFAWVGFKQTPVFYQRKMRKAGETKYPLMKMLRLALDGLISFSNALCVSDWLSGGA